MVKELLPLSWTEIPSFNTIPNNIKDLSSKFAKVNPILPWNMIEHVGSSTTTPWKRNYFKDVRYSKQGSHLLWLTVAIWNIVGPWFSAVWSSLSHKIYSKSNYNKVILHELLWQLDQPLLRTSIKCEITHFLPHTIPDNLKVDCLCLEWGVVKKALNRFGKGNYNFIFPKSHNSWRHSRVESWYPARSTCRQEGCQASSRMTWIFMRVYFIENGSQT